MSKKIIFCLVAFSLHLVGTSALAHSCRDLLDVAFTPPSTRENSDIEITQALDEARKHAVPHRTYAFEHPEKAYVKIIKLKDLQHSYLAVFNHRIYMNWALGRVTTFQTQNRMISDNALVRKNSATQDFAGHDLPAPVIRDFLRERPTHSLNPESQSLKVEEEFWSRVMAPIFQQDPEATLIAAALDYQPDKILSHEILHAQFYEKPKLREAVEKFWIDVVSPTDKKAYLKILKDEDYDIENHGQVINEFLAYTLEEGPPVIFPAALIHRYQSRLKDFLKD